MQKYQNVVQLPSGMAVPNATVTVLNYPSGTTPTVYSDNGSTTISNVLTTDANGMFAFYAAVGHYQLTISGAGLTTSYIYDILLQDYSTTSPNDYDEYTAASTACTGAITTACIWKLTKIGNLVVLTLPSVTGTASASASFTVGLALPSKYRPAADLQFVTAPLTNNGSAQSTPGMIGIVASTGVISVYKDGTGTANFTGSATAGLTKATGVSWTI